MLSFHIITRNIYVDTLSLKYNRTGGALLWPYQWYTDQLLIQKQKAGPTGRITRGEFGCETWDSMQIEWGIHDFFLTSNRLCCGVPMTLINLTAVGCSNFPSMNLRLKHRHSLGRTNWGPQLQYRLIRVLIKLYYPGNSTRNAQQTPELLQLHKTALQTKAPLRHLQSMILLSSLTPRLSIISWIREEEMAGEASTLITIL